MKLEKLILVRHGQSTGNSREEDPNLIGDHNLRLTQKGIEQAQDAGKRIGSKLFEDGLVYTSPYRRARETCGNAIVVSTVNKVRVFEDPRLREVEHGYDDVSFQEAQRAIHGWFYYRFKGGESPADCYDRSSTFIDSLCRQADRKNKNSAIIFSHGITIRCLITRFLHLSVEQFENMANPFNGAVITICTHQKSK